MLKANLRGQVRHTALPKWKALLPTFEAVMNGFQAIQDAPKGRAPKITVEIEREGGSLFEEQGPVSGFQITDTGIGFNDENFDSFNTAHSDYKLARGGKGLGRFIWLRAFDRVEIETVFSEPDAKGLLSRQFVFDENYDPDRATPHKPAASSATGTVVRLTGFREPWKKPYAPADSKMREAAPLPLQTR